MSREIRISAKSETKPLVHFWSNCVGAGRANEGLRSNWQEHLRTVVRDCGFRYLRFHGLFHDDMFVYRKYNGAAVYNWQYIDELFDRMLEIGIRPFVEFGFFPAAMTTPATRTQFWWKGNVTPPEDFSEWAELIKNAVTHWVARYGIDEVRNWYFEVWNEPNLRSFWDGTKSQYFELYKVTVLAVKGVDALLRVGGPATSNFVPDDRFAGEVEDTTKHMTFRQENINDAEWKAVWVEDFLNYCAKEKLPVDFISTHPYPTDYAIDEKGRGRGLTRKVDATRDDLRWLRALRDRSAYPAAEIHLTEWSSSPSSRDRAHDYLPAATFVVKANIDSSGLADSLSYWTFTDVFEEGGAGNSIFHGGFGLINFQGIVKPTYHAYRFLHLLGDQELCRIDGCIVTKRSQDDTISILAYNYAKEEPNAPQFHYTADRSKELQEIGEPEELSITVEDLEPRSKFIMETLDREHGFAIKAWKDMGQPEPPTREQAAELRRIAMATKKEHVYADERGRLTLHLKIDPWSIVSIRGER